MSKSNPFKWRHYKPEIILLCVRWYLTYPLSYRQVAEMVNERAWMFTIQPFFVGCSSMHSYLDKRCRPHLLPTNDSWRVDETYIKVKGQDRYLYRAVDSEGNTLDFLLTALARCTLLPNAFSAKPPIGWRWSASAGSGEYRQHFSDWLGTCWWVFQLIE